MEKRFSQAAENNRAPILEVLKARFANRNSVLEIGSGSGQHSVYFAPALAHLTWHTSDLTVNHESIQAWHLDHPSQNLRSPFEFEIGVSDWPHSLHIDAVFSANTAHIMQPEQTQQMMATVSRYLPANGLFCLYGPFNINGEYTSEGNEKFDLHLANEGCGGIRDIAELESWADDLTLTERIPMPANNFMLVWQK